MIVKNHSLLLLILSFLVSPIHSMQMQRYRQAAQLVAAQTAKQQVLNKQVKPPQLKVEEPQMIIAVPGTFYFGGTVVAKVIQVAAVTGTAVASALVFDYLRENKKTLSPQEIEVRRKTKELRERATRDLNALRDCDGYLGPITQITNADLYLIEYRHKEPIKSLLAEFAAADAMLPPPNFDQAPSEGQFRRRTRNGPVVQFSQAAKDARAAATAQGTVLPSYRLRYNEETLTIDLLPANPEYEKILAAGQPKNPNGLYKERGPQHKLPLNGQKALDEAEWIQNKLWSLENGRLILFVQNSPGYYDGHFFDARRALIGQIMNLQARKRSERDAYWATRIAEMTAVEARENATPQELLNTVQEKTEEEKKEDEEDRAELEQRRPNRNYQALSGQPALENGQAILNEAIWDSESRRLYGFGEGGEFIVFAPQNQETITNLSSAVAHSLANFVIHRQKENRAYRRFARRLRNTGAATGFILNNYHPNGLYVPATGKPATALPQHGQAALDCAVIEYSTGNLWGIEGDRLILFTYRSKLEGRTPTFQYEGSFFEGDAPAGMLELVRRERQEMDRVRKAAGDRPSYDETTPTRPPIDEEFPYGRYIHIRAEGLEEIANGQQVLDAAVWDPTNEHNILFGIENDRVVSFNHRVPGVVRSSFAWQGNYVDTRLSLCTFGRELATRKQRETAAYKKTVRAALLEIERLGAEARIDIREVARIMDSYHPNGLYLGENGFAGLPEDGQAALDDAVLEPATGYYWGVENDKLIRFEFSGPINGQPYSFLYTGKFHEGNVSAGILELARNKKNRANAIKDAIRNRPRPTNGAPNDPNREVPAVYTLRYTIDRDSAEAIEKLNFDKKTTCEESYSGDAQQHDVYSKLMASLNKLGAIARNRAEIRQLLKSAITLNRRGQYLNGQHNIAQALAAHKACDLVIDYAATMADLGLAAGEGVIDGIEETIRAGRDIGSGILNVVTFPEEYIPRIKDAYHKATLGVCEFLVTVSDDIALMTKSDPALFLEWARRRNENERRFAEFTEALAKKYFDTPLRDAVRTVAQFLTLCESFGIVGELFCEAAAVQLASTNMAVYALARPHQALASEAIEVIAHAFEKDPVIVQAVLESLRHDNLFLTAAKASQEKFSRQVVSFLDKPFDILAASPGYLLIPKDPKVISRALETGKLVAREIRLAEYLDTSVGDMKKLQEAIQIFGTEATAISLDGPITKVLSLGERGAEAGKLGTARGSAYELERAYEFAVRGEQQIVFGNKRPLMRPNSNITIRILEIDIETATKFVECKNFEWSRMTPDMLAKRIGDLQSSLPELQQLARSAGKSFEFHSKHPIPSSLKEWLRERGITFFEG
jgi:hypothetical protein